MTSARVCKQPVVKTRRFGGSVIETLGCGHEVRWRDVQQWQGADERPCYDCARLARQPKRIRRHRIS